MASSISIEAADGYILRRELRMASEKLTHMLVLGYGIGFIALLVGGYRYFIVGGAGVRVWGIVAALGAASLVVTLVAPFLWQWPERAIRRFGGWVGSAVMTGVLVAVYFLVFWPVGCAIRAVRGSHPIYRWGPERPARMQGWTAKELPPDVARAQELGRRSVTGLLAVLVFFGRARHFFLIPALIILVSLGIALFFLQTSALAPFIYTLF